MTEQEYVNACLVALNAAGYVCEERRQPNGVWVVSGHDSDKLPFFAGHPEGRAESWRQACRLNGVQAPLWGAVDGRRDPS